MAVMQAPAAESSMPPCGRKRCRSANEKSVFQWLAQHSPMLEQPDRTVGTTYPSITEYIPFRQKSDLNRTGPATL
jgi:hypothetical protein